MSEKRGKNEETCQKEYCSTVMMRKSLRIESKSDRSKKQGASELTSSTAAEAGEDQTQPERRVCRLRAIWAKTTERSSRPARVAESGDGKTQRTLKKEPVVETAEEEARRRREMRCEDAGRLGPTGETKVRSGTRVGGGCGAKGGGGGRQEVSNKSGRSCLPKDTSS